PSPPQWTGSPAPPPRHRLPPAGPAPQCRRPAAPGAAPGTCAYRSPDGAPASPPSRGTPAPHPETAPAPGRPPATPPPPRLPPPPTPRPLLPPLPRQQIQVTEQQRMNVTPQPGKRRLIPQGGRSQYPPKLPLQHTVDTTRI